MQCEKCSLKAVNERPNLCKKHFIKYVEKTVKETINDYQLLEENDNVAVACSGGKDSTTLLYLLKKYHGDVTAVAVDEGIQGYRDQSLDFLKKFCKEHNIKLEMYSFEEDFDKPLDDMNWEKVGGKPCTTCGTLRRYLLNKNTSDYDKIAVGHNLDDEAQSVLMNLFRSSIKLMKRMGPKTSDIEGFTQRIKPLYFLKEKEIGLYSYLKGFMDEFTECPNAHMAYRIWLRDLLNEYEKEHPGTKRNIIKQHLKLKKDLDKRGTEGLQECTKCGEPSSNEICNACRIKTKI